VWVIRRAKCEGENQPVSDSARCAIYSRFSGERQNPLSIDQQIRKFREYAERHALHVFDRRTFADEAISSATD
jgi:DNA invertase Pin-like site-specific DNA recombinase